MANQRYFKIVCFRFPTNVTKKSNIFVFGTKFIVDSKRSFSVLKIFGSKENGFVSFPNFFLDYKKFCFVLEICKLNQNVFVLFLSFGSIRNVLLLLKKKLKHIKKFRFCSQKFLNK
jgi:hypothetical protein